MSNNQFHLSAQDIYAQVDFNGLIDALQRMHREPPADLRDMLLEQPHGEIHEYCLIRAAWQAQSALGVKIANIFPANQDIDLPAIHAAYILFDGKTGVPTRSIDGTALTYLKTAADSALGSRLLARADSKNFLMVGAGAMAPYLIRAHLASRPSIAAIRIWNRSAERRDALVATLKNDLPVEAAENLAESAAWADIICCATMATEPLIKGAWLTPGVHIDLVGAYRKDMREADDETMARSRVFVDSRATTIGEIGELVIPIANGTMTEDDVRADLYDLCAGAIGRTRFDEITLFKNGGGGHLDLMTARHIQDCIKA